MFSWDRALLAVPGIGRHAFCARSQANAICARRVGNEKQVFDLNNGAFGSSGCPVLRRRSSVADAVDQPLTQRLRPRRRVSDFAIADPKCDRAPVERVAACRSTKKPARRRVDVKGLWGVRGHGNGEPIGRVLDVSDLPPLAGEYSGRRARRVRDDGRYPAEGRHVVDEESAGERPRARGARRELGRGPRRATRPRVAHARLVERIEMEQGRCQKALRPCVRQGKRLQLPHRGGLLSSEGVPRIERRSSSAHITRTGEGAY